MIGCKRQWIQKQPKDVHSYRKKHGQNRMVFLFTRCSSVHFFYLFFSNIVLLLKLAFMYSANQLKLVLCGYFLVLVCFCCHSLNDCVQVIVCKWPPYTSVYLFYSRVHSVSCSPMPLCPYCINWCGKALPRYACNTVYHQPCQQMSDVQLASFDTARFSWHWNQGKHV